MSLSNQGTPIATYAGAGAPKMSAQQPQQLVPHGDQPQQLVVVVDAPGMSPVTHYVQENPAYLQPVQNLTVPQESDRTPLATGQNDDTFGRCFRNRSKKFYVGMMFIACMAALGGGFGVHRILRGEKKGCGKHGRHGKHHHHHHHTTTTVAPTTTTAWPTPTRTPTATLAPAATAAVAGAATTGEASTPLEAANPAEIAAPVARVRMLKGGHKRHEECEELEETETTGEE